MKSRFRRLSRTDMDMDVIIKRGTEDGVGEEDEDEDEEG